MRRPPAGRLIRPAETALLLLKCRAFSTPAFHLIGRFNQQTPAKPADYLSFGLVAESVGELARLALQVHGPVAGRNPPLRHNVSLLISCL